MIKALSEHFSKLEGERFGSAAFYQRKQGRNESVVDFHHALTKLAKVAYPNPDNPMPDKTFLEVFLRGLTLSLNKMVIAKKPTSARAGFEIACKGQSQQLHLLEDIEEVNEVNQSLQTLEGKITDLACAFDELATGEGNRQLATTI